MSLNSLYFLDYSSYFVYMSKFMTSSIENFTLATFKSSSSMIKNAASAALAGSALAGSAFYLGYRYANSYPENEIKNNQVCYS
jgi:hypothetical protein